jgi:hypothetical protein
MCLMDRWLGLVCIFLQKGNKAMFWRLLIETIVKAVVGFLVSTVVEMAFAAIFAA